MKTDKSDLFSKIKKYEKFFSSHKYNGKGKKAFEILEGSIPVMISAPHSVNQERDGHFKAADMITGGIACYLHQITGCHVIYAASFAGNDPNYDKDDNKYQEELKRYVSEHDVHVLIDIHGSLPEREFAIEMGTVGSDDDNDDPSLKKYKFISDLIKYSFEYEFKDLSDCCREIWKNRLFDAGDNNTITRNVSENTDTACIQLEINRQYRNFDNKEQFKALISGFELIISTLANIDWNAESIAAYRLWQSADHKPQDNIEVISIRKPEYSSFCSGELLDLFSSDSEHMLVRLHEATAKTIQKIDSEFSEYNEAIENDFEFVMLPNRLIGNIFGREWILGREKKAALRGAPVIVYKSDRNVYPIGLPKADQIDNVAFSTELFDEIKRDSRCDKFDYVVFNRYTDSKLYVELDKADYADHGRVKNASGKAAKKVMLPRYYKILLGYSEKPLKMLRSEEYQILLDSGMVSDKDLKSCYRAINGECFYQLKESIDDLQAKKAVEDAEKASGFFDTVDLLKIPKKEKGKLKLIDRIKLFAGRAKIVMLNKAVGKASYYLKTGWTSETDDRNNVARLCGNMMRLIGVSENDKILIRFGSAQVILRVLENNNLTDYQIGIPAPARKILGMNSVNDIVVVHRDMVHTFLRHSQEQTIAILGTVLAVFQVISNIWAGILVCIVLIPCIMYFVLNEERIRVK